MIKLALLLATLPAFAGNDGPSPSAPPVVIAKKNTFCPPVFCPANAYRGTRVFSDGTTQSYDHSKGDAVPEIIKQGETLTAPQLAYLEKEIESLKAAQLVPEHPDQKPCFDGPDTEYTATKASGDTVNFARFGGCQNYSLPGGGKAAADIKSLLDSIQ